MLRPTPNSMREYLDRLPTADLYFLNPLRLLKQAGMDGRRLPPVRRLAPNVYAVGHTGVIVRYGGEADIERLRRAGGRRLVYIADDDFTAGAEDRQLPERYRRKLAAFADGQWPALRDTADVVIVPGSVLAAAYGRKARIVAPAWHRPPAPLGHFEAPRNIEIVHLGTGSHLGDLAALAPAIADILRSSRTARFTLFSPGPAPRPLQGHPQVRVRRPMAWWRYKLSLPRMRYHLALYPLAETAFNRARSANKLYEHALVGAASLMTPNPALREAAGPGLAQLFVDDGPETWAGRMADALADPRALRRRAEATRAHILAEDPLQRSADAWRQILAEEAG